MTFVMWPMTKTWVEQSKPVNVGAQIDQLTICHEYQWQKNKKHSAIVCQLRIIKFLVLILLMCSAKPCDTAKL